MQSSLSKPERSGRSDRKLFFFEATPKPPWGIWTAPTTAVPATKARRSAGEEQPEQQQIVDYTINSLEKSISHHTSVNQIVCLGIVQMQSQVNVVGRLQYYLPNWKLVTNDRWIWDTIMGYKIVFANTLTQVRAPPPNIMWLEETQLVQEELDSLLDKWPVV